MTSRFGACHIFFDHICAVRVEICYTRTFAVFLDFNKDPLFYAVPHREDYASLSGGDIVIINPRADIAWITRLKLQNVFNDYFLCASHPFCLRYQTLSVSIRQQKSIVFG